MSGCGSRCCLTRAVAHPANRFFLLFCHVRMFVMACTTAMKAVGRVNRIAKLC